MGQPTEDIGGFCSRIQIVQCGSALTGPLRQAENVSQAFLESAFLFKYRKHERKGARMFKRFAQSITTIEMQDAQV